MLNGVINIYKEKGYTSHDVVNIVRKKLNKVKTGHTGTLDPDAEGVLPICIGKATKISEYLTADVKRYRANLILGVLTDTLDLSGNIIDKKEVSVDKQLIYNTINSFVGEIEQIPPMYSAIKQGGKRLYELARAGLEVERKKRAVTIFKIEVLEFVSESNILLDILCSKGTYIRSLCADIGDKLLVGGVMGALTRIMSGSFAIENSVKLDEFSRLVDKNELGKILLPIDDALKLDKFIVKPAANKFLFNGNRLALNYIHSSDKIIDGKKIFIYSGEKDLIGIYIKEGNFIKPLTMLYSNP
ncbi:MAG: tRNA pseudouridine(55) synthase TruB [Clostridiales bacterium]|jgi:tRNA pseudouridine55 synthase|nr:tRNA pseudouridine(55) synthase TruB [Clostridiales bacterium]